jgi:hypothetical protein
MRELEMVTDHITHLLQNVSSAQDLSGTSSPSLLQSTCSYESNLKMASSTPNTAVMELPPLYKQFTTTENLDNNTNPFHPNRHQELASDNKRCNCLTELPWRFVKRSYPENCYWIKIPRNPIDDTATKVHVGISDHKQTGVCESPDIFFTCALQPRSPNTTINDIIKVVARIAPATGRHRVDLNCDCVLWNSTHEDTDQCLSKAPWPYRIFLRLDWLLVRFWKMKHDWLCSCACFDSCV